MEMGLMKAYKFKKAYRRKGRIVHAHKQRYNTISAKQKSIIGKQKRAKGLKFEYKVFTP